MKNLIAILLGVAFLLIGLLGLIIPIIPGILFLLVAAVLLSSSSPALRNKLDSNPRMHRLLNRIDAGSDLGWIDRAKLTMWACLAAITNKRH